MVMLGKLRFWRKSLQGAKRHLGAQLGCSHLRLRSIKNSSKAQPKPMTLFGGSLINTASPVTALLLPMTV